MQKINTATSLRNAILELEMRQANEGKILKEQFHIAYESLKPLNLIKNTFKQAAGSVALKENLLNTSVGLTAGYLSKILFEGVSHNPLKKLLGSALMFGITNLVTKNPETLKSIGMKLLKVIRSRPSAHVNGTVIAEEINIMPSKTLTQKE
ncbi:MAG TPA: hypothetical protein VIZ28_07070 [Chitinophagaceae bacterium]